MRHRLETCACRHHLFIFLKLYQRYISSLYLTGTQAQTQDISDNHQKLRLHDLNLLFNIIHESFNLRWGYSRCIKQWSLKFCTFRLWALFKSKGFLAERIRKVLTRSIRRHVKDPLLAERLTPKYQVIEFFKLKCSGQICQIFLPNWENLPNLQNSVKIKYPLNVSKFNFEMS